MDAGDDKFKLALGFLTVVEHPQHGLFGGYLILNLAGRPLEFHCTAPVKPNRAQEILYGPTLRSFLYGEQIGQTLLAKSKVQPLLICTNHEAALAVREHTRLPVTLVLSADSPPAAKMAEPQSAVNSTSDALACTGSQGPPVNHVVFQLGRNRLAVLQEFEDDRRAICEHLAEVAESFDLTEPFHRICEAIEEAHQAVRSTPCAAA